MKELDLSERVGIVTGANRGIGLQVARRLAQQGANLVLVSTDSNNTLGGLAAELEQECGVRVLVSRGDVANPETASAAVKLAHKEFRRLDVLVNNAGILRDARIGMITNETIEKTLATNVASIFHFTQASARLMARNDTASIINLSSIIGRFGNPGQMVYGASKAAVIGATKSSAKELAESGIRVNSVAPGYIETDMTSGLDDDMDARLRGGIGMGRAGSADDVAKVVLFLASDLSQYVTGQTIGVDGSMVI